MARTAPRLSGFRRAPGLGEALAALGGYLTYFLVRGMTESDPSDALANARTVIAIERSLGVFVEPTLQAAILGQHWLVTAMNWIYIWGHWPALALGAIALYRLRPDGYRVFRRTLLISGAIGIVVFVLFPTAPPRLAGLDVVDTVTAHSQSYRLLQPPALTNQYAAVPSLHFGWNLLLGIMLLREFRHPLVRLAGVLSPVLMAAAIVLTANHYLLDAVAGGVVVLAALGLALGRIAPPHRSRRPGHAAGERPAAARRERPAPSPRSLRAGALRLVTRPAAVRAEARALAGPGASRAATGGGRHGGDVHARPRLPATAGRPAPVAIAAPGPLRRLPPERDGDRTHLVCVAGQPCVVVTRS